MESLPGNSSPAVNFHDTSWRKKEIVSTDCQAEAGPWISLRVIPDCWVSFESITEIAASKASRARGASSIKTRYPWEENKRQWANILCVLLDEDYIRIYVEIGVVFVTKHFSERHLPVTTQAVIVKTDTDLLHPVQNNLQQLPVLT